jgi:hypothetical protein
MLILFHSCRDISGRRSWRGALVGLASLWLRPPLTHPVPHRRLRSLLAIEIARVHDSRVNRRSMRIPGFPALRLPLLDMELAEFLIYLLSLTCQ